MIAADREQWKTSVKTLCATRHEEDRYQVTMMMMMMMMMIMTAIMINQTPITRHLSPHTPVNFFAMCHVMILSLSLLLSLLKLNRATSESIKIQNNNHTSRWHACDGVPYVVSELQISTMKEKNNLTLNNKAEFEKLFHY